MSSSTADQAKELEKQLVECRRDKEVINRRVTINPRVFMDVDIDGKRAGRIVIELFKDTTPRAAENFRALCTGEKGVAPNGSPLHYKGSPFSYGASGYFFIGGFMEANESIYGETWSTPENSIKKHSDLIGAVCMYVDSSSYPKYHGCLFMISLTKIEEWRNGDTVVVGRVVEGMDVVREIDQNSDRSNNMIIADCGELP